MLALLTAASTEQLPYSPMVTPTCLYVATVGSLFGWPKMSKAMLLSRIASWCSTHRGPRLEMTTEVLRGTTFTLLPYCADVINTMEATKTDFPAQGASACHGREGYVVCNPRLGPQ